MIKTATQWAAYLENIVTRVADSPDADYSKDASFKAHTLAVPAEAPAAQAPAPGAIPPNAE